MKTTLLALAALHVEAAIPGRTLEDCQNFAALFDNTCTDTDADGFVDALDDLSAHVGAEM